MTLQSQSVASAFDLPTATPLLQAILEEPHRDPRPIEGLVIATLSALSPEGSPEITLHLPGLPEQLPARSLCPVSPNRLGAACAVMFEQGNPARPVIMGFLHQPQATVAVQVDGERQVIEAEKEIVLKCGKASITLTRAGKVIIRGTYVLSRSSGANRIKGGSVEIN